MTRYFGLLLAALLISPACDDGSANTHSDGFGVRLDADPSPDLSPDAQDAEPPELPHDAAPDVPRDAAPDVPQDAEPDLPQDAEPNLPHDAEPDLPHDAEPTPDAAIDCADDGDCPDDLRCVYAACAALHPLAEALVLNEILMDGTADDDANGDGDVGAMEDEFIELVNTSDGPIDLSGVVITEQDLVQARHRFAEGSFLRGGQALVLFGGGEPSDELKQRAPNSLFVVARPADPGFSFGLNLGNEGDVLEIHDAAGLLILRFAYGTACAGQDPCAPAVAERSLTRSPDLVGGYGPHPNQVCSPGTRVDGQRF